MSSVVGQVLDFRSTSRADVEGLAAAVGTEVVLNARDLAFAYEYLLAPGGLPFVAGARVETYRAGTTSFPAASSQGR